MKSMHRVLTVLTASVLGAVAATALAQSPNTESTTLTSTYTAFAGSQTNAAALVDGLRDGTSITLETTTTVKNADGTVSTVTTPTAFQPATGKLGYGNVNIALALARNDLASAGIADPTGAEIEAALNGGTVMLADGTSQTLAGVLALRAQGQGWGTVANTLGVKLGNVVSASKTDHAAGDMAHASHDDDFAAANRPARPDHPVHPDRPQRPDVPQRPAVPQRPDIPDRGGRPGGH